MKTFVLILALAALAACSKANEKAVANDPTTIHENQLDSCAANHNVAC